LKDSRHIRLRDVILIIVILHPFLFNRYSRLSVIFYSHTAFFVPIRAAYIRMEMFKVPISPALMHGNRNWPISNSWESDRFSVNSLNLNH